jgi:hypothetical protein
MIQSFPKARAALGAVALLAVTLTLPLLAGCHDKSQDVNRENFTTTISDFLAKRGHLCLAKYTWPIYVTTDDQAAGTRDAVQMPVLEKLKLVSGKDVMVERTDETGKKITATARQYQLTDEGRKYYVHFPEVVRTATTHETHQDDFCAATLTLDKVVGWERPAQVDGKTATSVIYTYKIEPAVWAQNADAQRVFPMIKRVIEGAGTMQMREGVYLGPKGWVADEVYKP